MSRRRSPAIWRAGKMGGMDHNPYEAPRVSQTTAAASKPTCATSILWLVAIVLIGSDIASGVTAARFGDGFANPAGFPFVATICLTAAVYLPLATLGHSWPHERPAGLWTLIVLVCLVAAVSLLFRVAEIGQVVEVYQAKMRGMRYMNCAPPPRLAIWVIDTFGNAIAFSVACLVGWIVASIKLPLTSTPT